MLPASRVAISGGKVEKQPLRKIKCSEDPPIDSTRQSFSRRKPKSGKPAANHAETKLEPADASPQQLRPEKPQPSLIERYRESQRQMEAQNASSDKPAGTERVETSGHTDKGPIDTTSKRSSSDAPTPETPAAGSGEWKPNGSGDASARFSREQLAPKRNPIIMPNRQKFQIMPSLCLVR
jgi:hypothetical protein